MTQQIFLRETYFRFVRDVLGCVDIILEEKKISPLDIDCHLFEVARNFRKRPVFRNVLFLAKFVLVVLQDYPSVFTLITDSPKVSPFWLTSLLTFTNVPYECEKNNSK